MMNWKALIFTLAIAAIAGVAYVNRSGQPSLANTFKQLTARVSAAETKTPPQAVRYTWKGNTNWNKLVSLDSDQKVAIGLRLVNVEPQTEPMKLELNGTTAYDPDTLTQIRPRFDSLVTNVHKTLGDAVSKGEALVELYSTELAKAKTAFQVSYVQWLHDKRLLATRGELARKGAISQVDFAQTQNDEAKSHLDHKLALEQLVVFGLTPEEIDPLLEGLSETSMSSLTEQKVSEKASMTLRSPADGIVIKRDVVRGNLYEPSSVLMVIAPVDHLRVYANVYESDIDLVQRGQEMVIFFPFQERNIHTKVEVISNQVDPDTHAMRVRTTITNPGDRLKSDMLIRAELHIPPVPGYTVIPRNALVTTNGRYYVFVKTSQGSPTGAAPRKDEAAQRKEPSDLFERKEIRVAQERSDRAIVSAGLESGEQVVGNGSLILGQIYEDMSTLDTGSAL